MNVNNVSSTVTVMKQIEINNKNIEEASTVENKNKAELIKEQIEAKTYKVDLNKTANLMADDLLLSCN